MRKHDPTAPQGVNAIIRRYADTCHDTDIAFIRGYLTIHEVQDIRARARLIRDADLLVLRHRGGQP